LRAERRASEIRERLHAAIRDAYEQGEQPAVIARVAGLTRQRVYQIVKTEP